MEYNFDELISRKGSCSYKWDGRDDENLLPLWVADMDFRVAEPIMEALRTRVEHGIFGYTKVPESYYEAISSWFNRRHGWNIRHDWVIYTTGVVPAISAIIKAFTKPGDKVLIQTPVYNCFYSSIRNNGCTFISNPLILEGNRYVIDFDDFERKASDPLTKIFLLCNPHNPAGRIWTREELRKMGEICRKHGVIVVSDEIHCEIVLHGREYVPFASVSPEFEAGSVTCVSPTKAFNIAGLQIANIVAADVLMRAKINKAININEVCDVNPFGVNALIAAYNEGEEWLEQALRYIEGNWLYMKEFCAKKLPGFPLVELEATYLAWMDCRSLGMKSADLEEDLIKKTGLWLNAGSMYGVEGEGFMRWNLACPRSRLTDALNRFVTYVDIGGD